MAISRSGPNRQHRKPEEWRAQCARKRPLSPTTSHHHGTCHYHTPWLLSPRLERGPGNHEAQRPSQTPNQQFHEDCQGPRKKQAAKHRHKPKCHKTASRAPQAGASCQKDVVQKLRTWQQETVHHGCLCWRACAPVQRLSQVQPQATS